MKKNILKSKFIKEMGEATANMYRQGWDERNGGNVSYLLYEQDVEPYLNLKKVIRRIPTGFEDKNLNGLYFCVTGTGKYFKNVQGDPETNLGVIRIVDDGKTAELLWGFKDGGSFTSELPAHLMTHMARLGVDKEHRIVIHTHPTYTVAMSGVCQIDEKEFTRKLWQIHTESVVVFPDGIGVLPCMVCGTTEIGRATAEKMKKHRLVLWTDHGIYGVGRNMDEAFGLVETVEKMAQLYMLELGRNVNLVPDDVLMGLAKRYGVTPMEGILD